jgi:hypothetical protein
MPGSISKIWKHCRIEWCFRNLGRHEEGLACFDSLSPIEC